MGLWRVLSSLGAIGLGVLLFTSQGQAQSSPFRTAIDALPCARNLTITDLAQTPVAEVAEALHTFSFAAWQGEDLTPERQNLLVQLFNQIEAYGETARQTGGATTGLADALAAFGATLDANAYLRSPDMILSAVNIAAVLIELNCREDALRLVAEFLPNARQLADDPQMRHYLIAVLQAQAPALAESGRLEEALETYVELETVLVGTGDFHQRAQLEVAVRINRAVILRRMGRLSEAETVINDAVEMATDRFGEDSNEAGFALNALAVFYSAVGANVDLDPIYSQIIAIRLKHLGDKKFDTALSYQNRGQWRRASGDADGAVADFEEALRILERAGLAKTDRALAIRSRLALLKSALGRLAEAEAEFAAATEIARQGVGLSPLRLAQFFHEYALFLSSDRPDEAETFFSEAISLRLQYLGNAHPFLAESYAGRANARLSSGAGALAVFEDFRAAGSIYERWLMVEASRCRAGNPPLGTDAKRTIASAILTATVLMEDLDASRRAEILTDVVRLIQIASANDVSNALTQLALRSGETSELRRYQELLAQSCVIEETIQSLRAQGATPDTSSNLKSALADLDRLDLDLTGLARQIDPSLIDQVAGAERIVDTSDLSDLLEPGESALTFLVLEDFLLRVEIERLDAGLGIRSFANIDVGSRDLRKMSVALDASIEAQAFDRALARDLYSALFDTFQRNGDGQLYVVPDGGIDRLSFSVLLTEDNHWFADAHAHSIIPSLSALAQLKALRGTPRSNNYFGIGDPALSLTGGTCAEQLEDADVAGALGAFLTGKRGAVAAEDVRDLCSLSHAGAELGAVATILGGDQSNLLVGSAATEAAVRHHDFSQTGILSFATHGLMAGAALNLPEPALILTPPDTSTNEADDGVLLASDIANLDLDNIWLATLSACDTSAGDRGGEGLTGIGRAFLFAGVETLLVSHWAVDDAATKDLLETFYSELLGSDRPSVSEALRRAMIRMRTNQPEPYFWGAFAIVGDGALQRP